MQQVEAGATGSRPLLFRTDNLCREHQQAVFKQTDRMFAVLMIIQWLAGIAAAFWISPKAWAGQSSYTHPHIWAALFLGAAISIFPILLAVTRPGEALTRYTIAVGQMLMGALLIHLTGGRIETHFHVFGSLAFLSFYRDWRVLVPAAIVVAVDHLLRGILWPQSVYGVLTPSSWRWLEHEGWVIFECIFLVLACIRSKREMWEISERTAESQNANELLDLELLKRKTAEEALRSAHGELEVRVLERTAALQNEIAERERIDQALRRSEEHYRLLFESNPQPMWVYDLETLSFLAVNEAAIHHYGYSREEFLAMTIRDIRPREDVPALLDAISQVSAESERMGSSWRHCKKDGTVIDVEITAHTLDFSGRRAGLALATDITERKRAEQAVRESEVRYKTLFEAATDAIMILDTEGSRAGRILAANHAAAATTGYTVEELLNLNVAELREPEQAKRVFRDIECALDGSTMSIEISRRRKDGSTFPVEVNASLVSLGDKRYILAFVRDMTQRKQMEKEATMLAHAVRSIQECVSITDTEHHVLFVNDAFVKTYGFERDEVLGKKLIDLVRVKSESTDTANELMGPGPAQAWEGEVVNRRKDGTVFPINLCVSPIHDDSGQTIALAGIAQDITDRKRSIAELQNAKETAEAANRAKSEFLANMSHEIRTPMNGIVGMTELALDTELTAEQREYLKMVKLSADSLLGIINDVLDFSKIEAGRLELDPAEFNLQDAVDEVMKTLGVRAHQKGLELAYYLRPGVPERVVGDVGRLRQILVNLVGNAIKFTERGEVIVRVQAEAQTSDEVVLHFSVKDTGIGIPPGKETLIFESFTQADGSTTRKYGGTGLGLTISSQLVQMMSGKIWVESPVDLPSSYGTPGSMFHFTGSFALPLESASTADPSTMFDLEGVSVLVVDDNATNRKILEVQLSSWQMKPALVDGAQSALQSIAQAASAGAPFKLVLLDFHMPEMDGLALAEEIKSLPEGREIRIIMMSSSVQRNTHRNEDHARDCRIDASLLKPVKATELLSVIRAVLGADPSSQTQQWRPGRKSAHPSRVLVAEDSAINLELIKRLLEKWGHTVVVAENGFKLLSLFENERFDLVLMDLQMPEMNGFEATSAIRRRELGDGTRIPIIALTAHALKGDRQRCIEAGMDDYVSKPIDVEKLFDVVETAASQSEGSYSNCEIGPNALDLDGLMRNVDGDAELSLTLAKVFAESSWGQLEQISNAIARGDAEALARGAHLLKGSVATFGARAAVDAAVQLEGIARSGNLRIAGFALAKLEKEIDRLRRELQAFEQVSPV